MVANVKPTGRTMSMGAGLTLAGAVCLLCTICMSAIIAFMADKGIIQQAQIGYGVMILLGLTSAIGVITANGKIRRRKLLVSGITALIYFLELLGITALFFGGQYQGIGVTALMILCGAALPLLTDLKGRGGVKKRKYKIPSR